MADTLALPNAAGATDPAIGAIAIDYSSDDQVFTTRIRGLYLTTAGTLKVDFADGSTATLSALAAGTQYAFFITKIYKTGSSTAAGYVLR